MLVIASGDNHLFFFPRNPITMVGLTPKKWSWCAATRKVQNFLSTVASETCAWTTSVLVATTKPLESFAAQATWSLEYSLPVDQDLMSFCVSLDQWMLWLCWNTIQMTVLALPSAPAAASFVYPLDEMSNMSWVAQTVPEGHMPANCC